MAIITSEFSFVRFDGSEMPLPYINISDIAFQVSSDTQITGLRMQSMSGETLQDVEGTILDLDNVYYIIPEFTLTPDCFRIALLSSSSVVAVSNVFVKVAKDKEKLTSLIKYRCNEDSFGFTYCPAFILNSVRLPFHIKNPQFTKEQSVYRQRDGRLRISSATIGKEYQLETDYLNDEMHQSITIALSHDYVFINGELLTNTGDYTIDWQNYLTDNGERTAMASTVLSSNVTQRNSNCGSECSSADFEVFPSQLHFTAN